MTPFHCPIDHEPLSVNGNTLRCPGGHSFDRAKEGYYNLLLVQQKASLDPGDNKEMVEARRRFLEAGHFASIAERLAAIVSGIPHAHVLDAGCGEGYYLGRLKAALPPASFSGIDISKWAVKAAAKSHKGIDWAVASSKQLPFADGSQELVVCLFGFPFWESFRSVLSLGGHVLLVDPGPEHLFELRERVYDQVKATSLSRIDAAFGAGFRLLSEEWLDFRITLENAGAIRDLLAMTPHGHRITPEKREKLAALDRLTTRVSVAFRLLQR